ncbi:MAG: cation:proton antiporter [Bacteroidia bacterium]|nr:cation:proton antiporter [Bacteroidia bacterium]MBP7261132.1 cation:proton antiporter [Bacteroidia bacterium]MBP9180509.1 cation:proton antiporter [Bacteroidia bacterium]MBP9724622.1 cation:proton antiporter [Bacteroidia bacterium]
MSKLSHHELITLILSLGVMLLSARLLGELLRKFGIPLVVGEILAGIVLGPSLFGQFFPESLQFIFPSEGGATLALNGITQMSVIMLLFVAGLELELPLILKQGKAAGLTSIFSLAIPFAIGFFAAYYAGDFFGLENSDHLIVFSLFLGTALSITALPVIARILMDLKLLKTRIGMIVISSAMLNDLIGWLIFSLVLGLMNEGNSEHSITYTILFTISYAVILLTVGKYLIDKALPWIQNNFSWPGGILSIGLSLCFLGAALTEYIGIHGVFGAFIVGMAFGDSVNLKEQEREIIQQFITNIFAPLFFVSIGLRINFITNFSIELVAVVTLLAMISKIGGAWMGARLSGLNNSESMAIGFGMNARGAMEIILGLLALEAGIINDKLFVALVVMAILTSVISGPMMQVFCKEVVKK